MKQWYKKCNAQTEHDARETARSMLGVEIVRVGEPIFITPREIVKVSNHRARLNTPLEKIYKLKADRECVFWHTQHISSPVAIFYRWYSLYSIGWCTMLLC